MPTHYNATVFPRYNATTCSLVFNRVIGYGALMESYGWSQGRVPRSDKALVYFNQNLVASRYRTVKQ